LGSAESAQEARQISQTTRQTVAHFDADSYKILCRPVLTQSVEMVLL
jgi:excinuclease Cho